MYSIINYEKEIARRRWTLLIVSRTRLRIVYDKKNSKLRPAKTVPNCHMSMPQQSLRATVRSQSKTCTQNAFPLFPLFRNSQPPGKIVQKTDFRNLCVLNRVSSWYLNKGRPTWWHLLYYINLLLNMFQMLIHPSSGACDYLLRHTQ